MLAIEEDVIEQKIKAVLEEIKEQLETPVSIDCDCLPSAFFKSQVLVTAICRIAAALDVDIPNNCYPFYDKSLNKQLTIREAAQALHKKAKHKQPQETTHGN